nr:glycosyltransferase family 2 protein [Flavihumibacter solisilvae]
MASLLEKPVVTVVVPSYNSSSTIERTLQSVIKQTYSHLDIIVVDDCSADYKELNRIVSSINDSRIRVFRHEVNRNGSAARNTGVSKASGLFVAFLDSDDEWMPDHIDRCVKLASNQAPGNEYLIYSRMDVRGRTSNYFLPASGKAQEQSVSSYLFMKGGFISTCGMFMPISTARMFPFNENLIRHQDYDLVLKLEASGVPFLYSDHVGAIVHWENSSPATKGGTIDFSLNWALNNKSYFDKMGFSGFILKHVVWPLLRKGEYKDGFKFLKKYCNPFLITPYNWYVTLTIIKARFFQSR